MRISDWSSDVGSSYRRDERVAILDQDGCRDLADAFGLFLRGHDDIARTLGARAVFARGLRCLRRMGGMGLRKRQQGNACGQNRRRSEEHTSELQSLMRISYAVFCLKKKK